MCASRLSLPQPLNPQSLQAFVLFPWRILLEDGGPFPVISGCPDTLEYDMQLCLCRLSDCDLKVAHGELVGLHLLMDTVLLSSSPVMVEGPPGPQATLGKNTQLFLAKSLCDLPALCGPGGLSCRRWSRHLSPASLVSPRTTNATVEQRWSVKATPKYFLS